jgi:uncharacterized membrane-anchored protein
MNDTTIEQASKVPEPTAYFWIVKILTTAMGEATSDYLVNKLSPPVVVVIGFVVFALALVWQVRRPRYEPPTYWTAALMVSVFGTMAADVAHVGLGIPTSPRRCCSPRHWPQCSGRGIGRSTRCRSTAS